MIARPTFFFLVLALVGVLSCHAKPPPGRLRVVASIFPVYDLTRRIAGPDADVILLTPPGGNAPDAPPSAEAIDAMRGARVAVLVGLGLEPALEARLAGANTTRVLKVGDRVPTLTLQDEPLAAKGRAALAGHDASALDPHVWLDPQRARLAAKAIAEELARSDGAHANAYRQRASTLDAALEALDAECEARTAPWRGKGFVTLPGSFGYFAERYHLTVLAASAPTVDAHGAPPADKLVDALRSSTPRVIFREPQADASLAAAVATPLGARVAPIDPIGGGAGGTAADSYEALVRSVVNALASAFE